MASSERNLITRINSSTSILQNSSLGSLTTSINSGTISVTNLSQANTKNITLTLPYIPTPLTNNSVVQLGFFDIGEYIKYLSDNGVGQTISFDTNGQITGSYNATNITLIMNIVNASHPNLYITINVNKSLNVSNNVINSNIFQAQVAGYVSSKPINDKKTILKGQNNLKGTIDIKIVGKITLGKLDADISGTFSGDFRGTIQGKLLSNLGKIDQQISIKIIHTNYTLS
jgi:hypothetical protein